MRGVALLLEVVLGLGLFSISLLLLFGVFPMAHRATTQARKQTAAAALCRESLEIEMRKDYDAVSSTPPLTISHTDSVDGVKIETDFQIEVLVDEVNTAPPDAYFRKNVSVIVSYLQDSNRVGRIVLETSIFK